MTTLLFPICTERLRLRPVEWHDADALWEVNRYDDATRYILDEQWTERAQAENWIRKQLDEHYPVFGYGQYCIELLSSGKVIGWCGLKFRSDQNHVDLSYRLHPAHWKKGYATEAAEAMLLHGHYTLGIKRIVAWVQESNTASHRVLAKLGGKSIRTWQRYFKEELTEYEFIRPSSASSSILFCSDQLDFREITEEDTGTNFALNTDPDVVRYTGNSAFASVNACREFYSAYRSNYTEYGYARWMVTLRETDECIGWCGLKYLPERDKIDLGYRLFRRFWRKHLGSEAAKAALNYGIHQLRLKTIYGYSHPENTASIHILEKCGMQFDTVEVENGITWQRFVYQV